MKLLLDRQVFLWFISSDKRLLNEWRDAIRDPANLVCLSVASVWEAVIKQQLGNSPFPDPPKYSYRQSAISIALLRCRSRRRP